MLRTEFQKVRWGFLLQVGGLTLLFAYLILFNSTNSDFMDVNEMLAGVILLSILAGIWLLRGRKAQTGLEWPLVVYCGVYALTSATSIDPRRSFGEGLYLLASIFIFLAAAELVSSGIPWERILLALGTAGGIYMIFLWMPFAVWYRDWLAASPGQWLPSITYRLPTPTVNSFFLNGLLFIGVAGLLRAKGLVKKLSVGMYLLSVLGLNYLASARSAWLGDAAGLAMVGVLLALEQKDKVRSTWRFFIQRKWLLGIGIIFTLLAAGGGGYILYRQTLNPTHGDVIDSRTAFWGPAWAAFVQHPLLGQGPATYPSAYLELNSSPPQGIFPHAHSVPLNILAEMGLVGLLAFGLVYFQAWRRVWQQLQAGNPNQRALIWAAAGLLVCFSIQGFFDCYNVDPMGLWVMLMFMGITIGRPIRSETPAWLKRPLWLVLLVAGAWLNYSLFVPYAAGVKAADQGDWVSAASNLRAAAAVDPYLAVTQQQLGIAESMLVAQGDPAALNRAISAFEKAARLDPAWILNHLDLGVLYLKRDQAGDVQAALTELKAAAQASSRDGDGWLNLGVATESAGQTEIALGAYANALDINPSPAYFWRSSPVRLQAMEAWIKAHPPSPVEASSLAGLESAAAADPTTGITSVELAQAYLQAGQLDEADKSLKKAALAYLTPGAQSLELDWTQADLLAAQGNFAQAAQKGNDALQNYLFKGVFGPGATSQVTYYTPLAFRRPAMMQEFVPEVTIIPLDDVWGKRMAKLADWYRQIGLTDTSDQIVERLNKAVPDIIN